jgi:hypothetical protein
MNEKSYVTKRPGVDSVKYFVWTKPTHVAESFHADSRMSETVDYEIIHICVCTLLPPTQQLLLNQLASVQETGLQLLQDLLQ